MNFLKGLTLSLLSFLLFLSLSIFGFAFQLNQTVLNPDFVTSELDRLDVSSLVGEFLVIEAPPEAPDMAGVIKNTIADLEPLVKEQVSAAIYSIYDYLLGESQNLDLALTLKNTILSPDFVASLLDKLDIGSLAGGLIKEELTKEIPPDMEFLATQLEESLDDAITEAKPAIRDQVHAAAGPFVDYLLGESQSFSVTISLEPVIESLKGTLRESFLESPPPELANQPRSTLEHYFDENFEEFFAERIPATFELDETILGAEVPAQISEALAGAESALEQVRQYIGYFQLGYKVLIGLMVLLVAGIILLIREVKRTTRTLGTTFLTYGAFEYAGIFVAKYFAGRELPLAELPPSLQEWISQFTSNFLAPLEMFSLGLLIGGAVLIIVSFVYKPRQPSPED